MESFLYSSGYIGLFIASFMAASFLLFPVEALILVMAKAGYAGSLIIIVATLGGYFGCLMNYGIAGYGAPALIQRFYDLDSVTQHRQWERVRTTVKKYGTVMLFFSWLPVLGELLTAAAGFMKIPLIPFSIWVIVGRVVRFLIFLEILNAVGNG